MKNIRSLRYLLISSLAIAPAGVRAETFFSDTFSTGSTINSATPAAPTVNSTAYQTMSSKTWVPAPSIAANDLKFGIAATSAGHIEIQALFATNAVALTQVGDYIQMTVVFTNTSGFSNNTVMGFGLYNSSQVAPVAGGLNGTAVNSSTTHAIGGVQEWKGYAAQLALAAGNSRIMTRSAQTGPDNRNQDLITSGSGSQSFGNPGPTTVGSTTPFISGLPTNAVYTDVLTITLNDVNSLAITNQLFVGAGTNGTSLTQYGGIATNTTFLTAGFDGLAIGWRHTGSQPTTMDIASITVDGSVTTISAPPDITLQPVPVTVPNGGSAAFFVAAQGFNVSYQWKRYGTNLENGGNISGATSDTLIISPASAADVATGANGYYVVVTGAGNFSVNSTTNSLTLRTAANLTWTAAAGNQWDLENTASWQDAGANPTVFHYGDAVTFDDTASLRIVSLVGSYLSASSVTFDNTLPYTLSGSGSFAGPGTMIYKGSGQLTLNNANTHTGGTIISNETAFLYLQNYNGLGSGPVTLAKAGAILHVVPTGSASLGIKGDVNVTDDATIEFEGSGAFAGVLLGNLNGAAGETLTLSPFNSGTTNRYRVYGTNSVLDSDLVLNGTVSSMAVYDGTVLAPYHNTGMQIYNGVISGPGGIIQRGGGTTILAGQNTYTGGTFPTTGVIGFGADSIGDVTSGPIGTGPLFLAPELPNTSGSGQVLAYGGARTIANPIQYPSATNNLTLIVGGNNDLTFTGPWTLNGNDSTGTNTIRTIQVTNTALTTIAGVISDSGAGFGLTKTGSGVLALSATEAYSGPTTVSGGTLLVNGQIGAGAVTVTNGGGLGGSGSVSGAVTVWNARLVPGNQGIGTLTINNSLTLQASATNVIEVNKLAGSRDQVVADSITYAGTLFATNIAGAVSGGDSFQIFSATSSSGNFSAIEGTPGPGLAWEFNPANGTLSVVAGVATNPTNIVAKVSGNSLSISWPGDHLGWTLQSNSVSLTADAWFPVPGSTSVTNVTINFDPSKTNVFYRLKL